MNSSIASEMLPCTFFYILLYTNAVEAGQLLLFNEYILKIGWGGINGVNFRWSIASKPRLSYVTGTQRYGQKD